MGGFRTHIRNNTEESGGMSNGPEMRSWINVCTESAAVDDATPCFVGKLAFWLSWLRSRMSDPHAQDREASFHNSETGQSLSPANA